MSDRLDALRDLIQQDINQRGLSTDPVHNLINACPDDFRAACQSLATGSPTLAVVTGFYIPTATPPCGETDGPLGALFLARALQSLGGRVTLLTDDFCAAALRAGLAACALEREVPLIVLPAPATLAPDAYCRRVLEQIPFGPPTHLLAIERVGPSHTHDAIPAEHRDRCHTMRGRDVTEQMSPAHYLFEASRAQPGLVTIGIGDGGNEIGMGKIPWDVIRRNIRGGDLVACRVPTDHLIVCDISNWGAYALAAGIALLRGQALDRSLFDGAVERQLLQTMVDAGPLVDGVAGQPVATVDGLAWERYAEILEGIGRIC
jgi:hypothetical protein